MDVREAAQETAARALTASRAARELDLKRGEFELAVLLGHVRTVRGSGGVPPRVAQEEIGRLRAAEGFPDALRERVRTVGTVEGSELVAISPSRFTRLARTGHFTPIRFYLNRYRAIVWLYLADELCSFALDHPDLLSGRTPPDLRTRLDSGEDWRPRNWRGKRLGLLLRASGDPWERAAAIASVLDPATVADVVTDPGERSHLRLLRPEFVPGRPESPAANEVVERLLLADHPDEILWHRVSLAQTLREAREYRPAPRAGGQPGPEQVPRALPRTGADAGPADAAEFAPSPQPLAATRGGRLIPVRRSPHGRGLLRRLRWRRTARVS